MRLNKYHFFLWVIFFIVSCTEVKNPRYKDTSHLEQPPTMEITEKPAVVAVENKELKDTGLGDIVSLAGSTAKPIIRIKKLFDRSWNIVEQALKLSKIEITDQNREQGVYYVTFDPDEQSEGDQGLVSSMTFFLFKDDYEEAAYQLHVVWQDSDTEITAELINNSSSDLLDDDEDKIGNDVDGGAMLIKTLYKIIRDDLPKD